MNLAYLKKLTTFTDTTINIRNHKSDKFDSFRYLNQKLVS